MPRAAKLPSGLTVKQTHYAYERVRNGNKKKEAYLFAYDAENMSDGAISKEIHTLENNPLITQLVDSIQKDSQKALGATVEWKKAKLMQIAEYGLTEELVSENEEDEAKLRQINPSASVSALKELNAMDGDHAAVKSKMVVENRNFSPEREILEEAKRRFTGAEIDRMGVFLMIDKLDPKTAFDKVLSERNIIDGELGDESD